MKMTPTSAKMVAEAAQRNGRECADVAFLFCPPPWTAEQGAAIFRQMSEALISSYPLGSASFACSMEVIADNVRVGFNERMNELIHSAKPDTGSEPS